MFEMKVEDKFEIKGRGIVVTGFATGKIDLSAPVEIWNPDGSVIDSAVTGVERFAIPINPSTTGYNCGVLLRGSETLKSKDDIQVGAYMRRAKQRTEE